jgi:hypothetical protein
MPRIRRLAPWLLAALALAAALYPYVPADILTFPRLALALAILLTITLIIIIITTLLRRRRRKPTPQTITTHEPRRALERSLAAARRALGGPPARTWLLLGPTQHGKSTLAAALLGDLRDVTAPTTAPTPRCLVSPTTRTLILIHPPHPCELRPLLALRRPLDAILLVLSLPDLPATDPALRAHLQAIQTTLAVDVPIHLVCTKLDHLAGHSELVGDDTAPWGFALAAPDHLAAALRNWSRWVDVQRLARLASDPTPERRARLFTFAAAFARACDRLTDLAAAVTKDLPLRTVFFTAPRRDPAPEDQVLHDLANKLHLPLRRLPNPTTAATQTLPQPALLSALLAHDREATRTPAHHRRLAHRLHALAAALTLAALALALSAPAAATRQRTCLQDLADLTAPLADPTPLPITTQSHRHALHALHARLADPTCADPPTLINTYRRAVRRHLLHPAHVAREQSLTHLTTHPPRTVADQLLARDTLRAYLLLTANLSETPGPLDPAQTTWLLHNLQSDPAHTNLLTTFFAHATPSDFAFPRDETLVEKTRQLLNAHSDDDATLHAALAAADAACEPLALRALTHAAQLTAARTLPCSFTRPGWTLVQQQLSSAVDAHDHWILGRPPEPREQRLARLQGRYDAAYIGAWTEFLAGISVRRPTDHASAARLLTELTEGDPPLTRVFAGLDHHTRGLGRSRADLPAWIPDTTELAEIHRAFAPSSPSPSPRTASPASPAGTPASPRSSPPSRPPAATPPPSPPCAPRSPPPSPTPRPSSATPTSAASAPSSPLSSSPRSRPCKPPSPTRTSSPSSAPTATSSTPRSATSPPATRSPRPPPTTPPSPTSPPCSTPRPAPSPASATPTSPPTSPAHPPTSPSNPPRAATPTRSTPASSPSSAAPPRHPS